MSLIFRLFCDAVPACERRMQYSLEIITNRAVSPGRITSQVLSVPRRSYRPGIEFLCEVVLQPEEASASRSKNCEKRLLASSHVGLSIRLSVLPSVNVSVRIFLKFDISDFLKYFVCVLFCYNQ